MRDAVLPSALLCASLGLALGFATRQTLLAGLLMMTLAALAVAQLPLTADPIFGADLVFGATAIATALIAGSVYLPRNPAPTLSLALALIAGAGAGALIAVAGTGTPALARALPAALVALPAAFAIAHRGAIAVKVVASWLIAVSVLAATLPIVPTPGYVSDHMQ